MRLTLARDLGTAVVRVDGGRTVPLTVLREGRRWLLSFSSGQNPIPALLP